MFGGDKSFVWGGGLSPPKPPVATGLHISQFLACYGEVDWLEAAGKSTGCHSRER